MSKLTKHCTECSSPWIEKDRVEFFPGTFIVTNRNCEHVIFENALDSDVPPFSFADGSTPYPFQRENISLFLKSGIKAGCFDEMGLGKTVSALGLFRLYDLHPELFREKEVYPAAILVKSGLRLQWAREVYNRLGVVAQVIDRGFDPHFDLFPIHIYSMDLLKNMKGIESLPYKTIVIDECQLIKNPQSKRTNGVRDLIRGAIFEHEVECTRDETCQCPPPMDTTEKNVIVLSGTPIKNNAGEYFVISNLLRPDLFPSYEGFLKTWTHSYWTGRSFQVGSLRDPAKFKEYTKDFFIRHEQKEVLPDLPDIFRNFQLRVLEDTFEKKYRKEVEDYSDYFYESEHEDSFTRSGNLLQYMNRMRHIVGLAKTKDAVEFIVEFLTSCDRKLVVFHHHHDVGELISDACKEVCKTLELTPPLLISNADPSTREDRVREFVTNPSARLLIASTIKSGEGLNLQVCSDCLIVERQWNPANEEQAEGRFRRIGSKGKSEGGKVNSTYLVAVNSIDELFSEIIERKRKLIEEANRGEELPEDWDEKSVMKELQEVLAASGRKKYNVVKRFEAQK